MALCTTTSVRIEYNLQQFLPSIDSLASDVDSTPPHKLTEAALNAAYAEIHARTPACQGAENDGVDCPLTQCAKTAFRKLPSIIFVKYVNEKKPKTLLAVDSIHQRVMGQFPILHLQQSELESYYTAIRSRIQAASFLESLETVKPQSMAHAAEIYKKTNEESISTAVSPSNLELMWMSITELFEEFRDLQALDQHTVKASFGKYASRRLVPLNEASLIAKAVKSVRETCDLSFPKIDIREGFKGFVLQQDVYEMEQAEKAVLASFSKRDDDDRTYIGCKREELRLLGLIKAKSSKRELEVLHIGKSKNKGAIADEIMDMLLGEVVDDLNAIFEKKAARRKAQEAAQVLEHAAKTVAERPKSASPEFVGTFVDMTEVVGAIAAETSPDQGSPNTSDSPPRRADTSESTTPEPELAQLEDIRVQDKASKKGEAQQLIDAQEQAAPKGYIDMSAYAAAQ